MSTIIDNFHLLRPAMLWALLPVVGLTLLLAKTNISKVQDNWGKYVDPHLLKHLAVSAKQQRIAPWLPLAFFILGASLIFAISGPSWQQREMPSYEANEPIVTVLSLAQSMNSQDVSPNRLKRASHKLRDILEQTKGDQHGLVIYSDTPFIAAPLTSDPKVIAQMLPELSTSLMPVLGNRLDLAIEEATGLLERAHGIKGTILLLTDSIGQNPKASIDAAARAKAVGYKVSVLAIGKDASQTGTLSLSALAKAGGGMIAKLTASDADLNQLLPKEKSPKAAKLSAQEFQTDSWIDMGYYLLIIPIIICLFAFRRGLLFALVLSLNSSLFWPTDVQAAEQQTPTSQWQQLWQTPNQLGQAAFEKQAYKQAAKQFDNPAWKAASLYKSKQYQQAANEYAKLNQDYNLANAKARSGDLKGALETYDQYLANHPEDEDARFNRDLIAKLLKQQEQKNQQDKQNQQGQQDKQNQQGQQDKQNQQGQQDKHSQQGQQDKQNQQGQQDKQNQQGQQNKQNQNQPTGASQQAQATQEDKQDKDLLSRLVSAALKGNQGQEERQERAASQVTASPKALDQASEQQLKRVPDDPTGLLRARIRQHYLNSLTHNQ